MFVYMNSAHYSRRRSLTLEALKRYQEVPCTAVYLVELAYDDAPFEIAEEGNPKHLRLRTNGPPLWHKENLINIGVARLLPRDWEAFAWIDADTTIIRPSWASSAVQMLRGRYDVLQLYKKAYDEDMDHSRNTVQVELSFGLQHAENLTYIRGLWHPGYAWAINRRAYETVGGLYEYRIVGGGDAHMAMAVTGRMSTIIDQGTSKGFRDSVLAYEARAKNLTLGYLPTTLVHHFHGKKRLRRYHDRRHILIKYGFDPDRHLTKDINGILIPSQDCPQQLVQDIQSYLLQRNEDEGLINQTFQNRSSHTLTPRLFDSDAPLQWPDKSTGPARFLVFIPLLGLKYGSKGDSVAGELVSLEAWHELAQTVSNKGRGVLQVLGMVEDARHCYSRYAGSGYHCITLPARCRHGTYKVMTLDCAFEFAIDFGKPAPPLYPDPAVLIFSNADLVYTPEFVDAVEATRKLLGDRFVAVGRRNDLNITGLDHEFISLSTFKRLDRPIIPHAGWAVDYFVFTAASFPGPLPPFLVGRWRWDNALLLSFYLRRVPSVDFSHVVSCTHLGLHASDAAHHKAVPGSHVNEQLAADWNNIGHSIALGNIDYTEYVLRSANVSRDALPQDASPAGEFRLGVQTLSQDVPLLQGIRLAKPWHDSSRRYLFLVVVSPGALHDALNWVCLTKKLGLPEQLYLTYSSESSSQLRELGGQAITAKFTRDPIHCNKTWREVDRLIAPLITQNVSVVALDAKMLYTRNLEELIMPHCDMMTRKTDVGLASNTRPAGFDGQFLAVHSSEGMIRAWGDLSRCELVGTRPLTDNINASSAPSPMNLNDCMDLRVRNISRSEMSDSECDVDFAKLMKPQCLQEKSEQRTSCREQHALQQWVNGACLT